jgi:RsiW-degrading membrane proteinase PrsW (M82 family)
VYDRIEFNDPMDGIVYACASALGFATLENIIYVFSSLETSVTLAVGTGVVRALLSVPGHALFSSMWGYSLGQAKFRPVEERSGIIIRGLILAMILHGLFNFLLAEYIGVAVLVLVLVPGMWLLVNRKINLALGNK